MQKSLFTNVVIGRNKSEVANQLRRQQPLIRDFMFFETPTQAIRRPTKALSFLTSRMLPEPSFSFVGTPDECIEKTRKYVDLGVTYFMLKFPYVEKFKSLEISTENVVLAFKTI